jgi:hypothetical protein
MKETKAQIRPLMKLSVISALEVIKEEKGKSLGVEELLKESKTFKKYYKEFNNANN